MSQSAASCTTLPSPSHGDTGGEHRDVTTPVFLIVGLGASAGGLQALQRFFAAVPDDSGMAFVVIMHLSPEHESHIAEILRQSTAMPVNQVTDKVLVVPNRVYVIPPTKNLVMEDGHIGLTERERPQGRHGAIDLFFRTLADTHTRNAICIVLSGSGADGSVGIKRVKEAGGITLAQDPQDAEYDSMPRNAINTGVIDFVLPAAAMPAQIITVCRNASHIALPPDTAEARVDEHRATEEVLARCLPPCASAPGTTSRTINGPRFSGGSNGGCRSKPCQTCLPIVTTCVRTLPKYRCCYKTC